MYLNEILGNTGEVLVPVTCVQEEAEYQDLSGCTVQNASGILCKTGKRNRCYSDTCVRKWYKEEA